jgi:two-component system, OmpR family, response regulator VicR
VSADVVAEAKSMGTQKLILMIEDEPDVVKLVEFHLRRHGYQTVAALDGVTGLNEVFSRQPDLVILDLMLPRIQGFEVCRLLKSSPATRHIPVLILSASDGVPQKLHGFKVGATDYMTKPFDVSELMARVDVLLRHEN